ncbi:type II CRISPR RNA-guided endonuclease Cas9 [Microaceticoccus formicicus]|uniref:type II CRISPR RNA-guided endonuclease Cas9 n=1 Tax=Microaceticoccus formicicus TaxID=3118105 RepID=UPI003CD03C19|nr:type II CRISPR RNA-guided endonuclease Cas9 [Peptoniphilaceae bacterium AMB_02]
MSKKDYFLGLDLGTSSVGWAVTDDRYKLQRFNKKDMWGTRLFEEAKTAEVRRVHRSSRRRYQRKRKRISILQELFAEEIYKVDPTFFVRLKESKFHLEDKIIEEEYTLFNDSTFSDKEYYDIYPTIYHLRKDLMESQDKKDIRLIYLALHHIIKNRGHFLFEGQDFSVDEAFDGIFSKLSDYLFDQFGFEIPRVKFVEIEKIIINKDLNLRDKSNLLADVCETKDKQFKDILSVMIGSKRKLSQLFNDPELDEAEKKDIDFRTAAFDDEHDMYEQVLNENIILLDYLKAVYDWMILSGILESHSYISDAKIDSYTQHGLDLVDLKYLIKKYKKDEYNNCFNSPNIKNNYASYVVSTLYKGRKKADTLCNQEEVNSYFNKIIKSLKVNSEDTVIFERIINRLDEKAALPKLRTADNSVIPYQVHKTELDIILKNASKHHPFLEKKDETGLSVIEKIQKTMTFRIPYYVGPLNAFHSKYNGGTGNAWIVKKRDEEILPWNFEEVVDEEASAERFIRRMTNKCTYVLGADVIPKDSLLYEKFEVLNELNNLKIDGKPITVELKIKIYNELFKTNKKVTQKKLRSYLKINGLDNADDVIISGIDGDFKSSLNSYHIFKEIIGDKLDFEPGKGMVEEIILWKCIFESGGKIVRKKINDKYKGELSKEQLRKINGKNFTGWGRLSKEFLCEVKGTSFETGEIFESIIDALEKTNDNLMQLLSSKYSFKEELEKMNDVEEEIGKISYENLMEDVYLSPSVKRTVWQAITICKEISKIRKSPPKRIFVEMTRSPDLVKERKDSRRNDLISLYKNCKEDVSQFIEELENYDDRNLRAKALYLYYTQKGRCMYSGEKIDLEMIINEKDNALMLYDIDHIYPRSLTKDDSLNNLVLVKKEINQKIKQDKYPIPNNIRKDMTGFWFSLKEQGFITANKFYRLIRKEPLTNEELAGFINRQLVETGQSTKAVAELLKRIYPDTEIIYTKSRVVSDFRHKFDLLKCRELNNFHHAHDAFLNIVAGNAYHTKFTANPYNYIKTNRDKGKERFYNLERFFNNKVERNGYVAWDVDYHLPFIKKTLQRPTVNVTRMPVEHKGELFDATLRRKTNVNTLLSPIKVSDERLHDFSKYGGYTNIYGAFFFLVEHLVKNKKKITLEQVHIQYSRVIKNNSDLEMYCTSILNLINPRIIEKKIKMNSKVLYNGFPLYLNGRSDKSILVSLAKEIELSENNAEIFRRVIKERLVIDSDNNLQKEVFTAEELLSLYDEYLYLLSEGPFSERPTNLFEKLKIRRSTFKKLNESEKCIVLFEIHNYFRNGCKSGVDLRLLGEGKSAGRTKINSNITKSELIIINDSVTGLYSNKKVLNRI